MENSPKRDLRRVLEVAFRRAISAGVQRDELVDLVAAVVEDLGSGHESTGLGLSVEEAAFVCEFLDLWKDHADFQHPDTKRPLELSHCGETHSLRGLYDVLCAKVSGWLHAASFDDLVSWCLRSGSIVPVGDDRFALGRESFPYLDEADAGPEVQLRSLASYASALARDGAVPPEQRRVAAVSFYGVDLAEFPACEDRFWEDARAAVEYAFMWANSDRVPGATVVGAHTSAYFGVFVHLEEDG